MKKLLILLFILLVGQIKAQYYVCDGDYADRYHINRYCAGLNSCKGNIVAVEFETDASFYNYISRTKCCICIGGYHCNNRSNSSTTDIIGDWGISPGGYAAMGEFIALLIVGPFFVSNEIHIGSVHHLSRQNTSSYLNSQPKNGYDKFGYGISAQLEALIKNKSNSEIGSFEYGFRFFQEFDNEFFLNYKHIIYSPHTRISLYAGPTFSARISNWWFNGEVDSPGFSLGGFYRIAPTIKLDSGLYWSKQKTTVLLGISWTYQYSVI